MSTVIQIKRSPNVTAPTTVDLAEAELAYSYDKSNSGAGAKLYIEVLDSGNSEVIHAIGGKYYTDIVDGATNNNTTGKLVKRDASGNFSANVITANEFVGNITGAISGQASSAVIANSANALTTGRYIKLSGDVVGEAFFDGTGNADISATVIQANSVALGVDTTGDYVANLTAGTGIALSGQAGETSNITVGLTNTGVSAGTYGDTNNFPSLTVDAQGRITSASNIAALTPSSIATLTNKTFDVSNAANNKFSIQGNEINSYSGSGSLVILQSSPTINTLFVNNSDVQLDGGSGSYWAGQSGVAQTGDNKAGFYRADSNANGSLFTFGANGAGDMSVAVEGSLFIGSALPTNNGGLNTDYTGWLVVQSGGKFGGDIDTLGGLNLTDATNGKITFSDSTVQRTAYTSNHLTTANVVEITNLYFTNARSRAALTSGNGISYNSTTGNITLAPSGVVATTYGSTTNIPIITVDEWGRVTSASNASISTDLQVAGDSTTDTVSLATETLAIKGGTGITTAVSGNAFTITNAGVVSAASGGYGLTVSAATGAISITNTGVTRLLSGGHGISLDANNGNVTVTNNGVTAITGTANEIQVSGATGNITIGLPDNVTIGGDLSVTGNLNVLGNVTTIATVDLRVEDPLIYLAGNNYSSDLVDIGFIGNYYDGSSQRHAGLFRDASDSGKFKLFNNLQPEPNTGVIDTANASFTVATLVANLTGGTVSGLTANIAVSDGGTGRGTLTTNAVLFGQGTSAVGLATGSAYQVLQLNGSGVPVFAGLDGGTY